MPEEEEGEAPRVRPVRDTPTEGGGPAAHTRRASHKLLCIGGGRYYGQRELGLDDDRGQLLNPAVPLYQLPFTPGRGIPQRAEVPGQA